MWHPSIVRLGAHLRRASTQQHHHGSSNMGAAGKEVATNVNFVTEQNVDSVFPLQRYMVLENHCNVNKRKSRLLFILLSIVFFTYATNRYAYHKKNTKHWVKMPLVDIERKCPAPDYPVLGGGRDSGDTGKICITTLTDEKSADIVQKLVRWRSFDNLLGMTWPNRQAYANKHGYHLYDGSDLLDTSRPPSWSKILAVRRLLTEEACEWVFWQDADTVIMNSDKKVQDFLPSEKGKDFIVTVFTNNDSGYNAGAWAIRNSEWSLQFLDHWWGMKDFVLPKGQSHSGDNAALNAYLRSMDADYFNQHVLVPPKCHLNSNSKFLTPSEAATIKRDGTLEDQPWYMSTNHYHKGDLIAHVAGIDNKIDTIAMLLEDAQ